MRINKFISTFSNYSRRKADELIKQGRVYLNGKKLANLGININSQQDEIKIDGKIIHPQNKFVYLAFHKPKGYITSRKDEFNRKTIMDLLPKNQNLKPAGRLDKDTEGLILVSNDGNFINRYTHPKNELEKEYEVIIHGILNQKEKEILQAGILLENKKTYPAKIAIISHSQNQTFLKMTIHEGRKRQIRKMFDYIKHGVKYLKRIRIGNILLGSLKKGTYKHLTNKEINAD